MVFSIGCRPEMQPKVSEVGSRQGVFSLDTNFLARSQLAGIFLKT